MKYLYTNYLYELSYNHYTWAIFTPDKVEAYLLIPQKDETCIKYAISRELVYRKLGVIPNEIEFDIFEYEDLINYQIINEHVYIINEAELFNTLTSYARLWSNILYDFGFRCLGDFNSIIQDSVNALKINQSDDKRQDSENYTLEKFEISIIQENSKFQIKNSKGVVYLSFTTLEKTKKIFKLIISVIGLFSKYIKTLTCNQNLIP